MRTSTTLLLFGLFTSTIGVAQDAPHKTPVDQVLAERVVASGQYESAFFKRLPDGKPIRLAVTILRPVLNAKWASHTTVCAQAANDDHYSCVRLQVRADGETIEAGAFDSPAVAPSESMKVPGLRTGVPVNVELLLEPHRAAFLVNGQERVSQFEHVTFDGFGLSCSSATCRFVEE